MKKIYKFTFLLVISFLSPLLGADIFNAAFQGDLKELKLLIEKNNINVNSKDNDGATALMFACNRGHYEIVKYLIEHGADVNIQDKNGYTALIYANSGTPNGKEIVTFLLENKADYNLEDNKKAKALHYAEIRGNSEIIKILREAGAANSYSSSSLRVGLGYDVGYGYPIFSLQYNFFRYYYSTFNPSSTSISQRAVFAGVLLKNIGSGNLLGGGDDNLFLSPMFVFGMDISYFRGECGIGLIGYDLINSRVGIMPLHVGGGGILPLGNILSNHYILFLMFNADGILHPRGSLYGLMSFDIGIEYVF